MKRILVGTNGTVAAGAAVTWAARVAAASGADLVVASAWSAEAEEGDQSTEVERRAARHRLLDEVWSAPAREAGVRAGTHLLEGAVRDELPRFVVEQDADLVAIGTSTDPEHPNRLARDLLHHLGRPLAVVPAGAVARGAGPVVVGVDGSHASDVALHWAIGLAGDLDTHVTAVFAHDPLADSYPRPDFDNWTYHGEQGVRAELERAGGAVSLELVRPAGRPEDALASVADDLDAVAIVVGTRGRGGLHGLFVGRVAVHLVERAPHSIVVVPH